MREIAHRRDLPRHDVKYEKRSGRRTSGWICVRAVVEESKLRQLRKQTNQIDPAVLEPLSDRVLRDIVSASRDAGANTCNVELGCQRCRGALHAVARTAEVQSFNPRAMQSVHFSNRGSIACSPVSTMTTRVASW